MVILAFPMLVLAQHNTWVISGRVISMDETPLGSGTIEIKGEGLALVIETDTSGNFQAVIPKKQILKITVHHIGHITQHFELNMESQSLEGILIKLKQDDYAIQEINVWGKSETQKAKEQIVKAQIVETKAGQQQSSTLVEMMNRSAGVRIRQSGGMGSDNNIMLNGFQGKSIKTFKDGIPTDYLGASFNLSNLPINMLEHVEVYKGVLPTQLGADALGGAINLVSKKATDPFLATSYEFASFNTHRVSLNLYQTNERNKIFGGIDAFYNYSDNNYHVTAQVPNPETANVVAEKIQLFHNRYKQWYTELYGGWKDVSWADEFRLGLTSYYINRQNQFASLMERPFGASYSTQRATVIPTLRYKKSWLEGKLVVDQFAVFSRIKNVVTDTLSGSYDWYGQFHPAPDAGSRGEAGMPSLATLRYSNLTTRTGINYTFSSRHQIGLNVVFNDYNRSGSDPFGSVSSGENPIDLLSLPADYTKVVGTLGLTSNFFNNKFQNLAQIKYFRAHALGQEMNISTGKLKENLSSTNNSSFGFAEAIKWEINPRLFMRLSTEWATRLPEQNEIMGDGSYILSNFDLKPERSVNGNLGVGFHPHSDFGIEVNGFYRITKDMVLNIPVNLIYSQSSNVEQVRGIGLETDAFIKPFKWLHLNGNFTYQDFRLYNVTEPSILYLEKARLRNVPYFFSNLGATVNFQNTITSGDQFQAYWFFSYVHEYYLNYIPKDTEPDGFLGLWGKAKIDAPNIIPRQSLHTVGLVWTPFPKRQLSFNLECKNLMDAEVFDNFRIQNAGRSFHIKVNYAFHNFRR
ncbi:TonB-dependent receptor [Sphingobacterium lactis]|nr:TonB-dependent receptor plug domain-containing protein [Sphingobacterium lactis]